MPEQDIGPYRLLAVLGQGANSIVYKAWQPALNRPVTLKVLRRPEPDALRRLQKEARLTASLPDARVRQVYEVGQTADGQVYVALQYVDCSLRELIDQRKAQARPFGRDEVAAILAPIAGVLDEMHRRDLVHLDIKPENILVFKDSGRAVLADFGIVQKTGLTTQAGTPLYTSPEQAAGNRPVGPWSDIYSLAVVAYEMLAGRPPFTASLDVAVLRQHLEDTPARLRQVRRDTPADLDEAVARALSKHPRQRFATAGEFVAALGQRRTSLASAWRRTGAALAFGRRPWLALVLALVALSLGVGIFHLQRVAAGLPAASPTALLAAPTPPGSTPTPTARRVTASPTAPLAPSATIAATSTAMPTRTPLSRRTPSPSPAASGEAGLAYPAPYLGEPEGGAQLKAGQAVAFSWSLGERELGQDERYRFRFLKDGQAVGDSSIGRENWRHYAGPPSGPGTYEWCVDVVRVNQAGAVVQAQSRPACRQVTWKP